MVEKERSTIFLTLRINELAEESTLLEDNKIIVRRYALSNLSTSRWSLEEDLIRYAVEGFEAIGLWKSKLEDVGFRRAIDLVHQSRLQVSSLNWAGGFTGSDGCRFVDSVEDALDAIRLASQLNAGCLILHPGGRNGHTHKHANRLFRTAVERLLPHAEDLDVKLAIEPMFGAGTRNWTFYDSFADSLELLAEFDSPNFKTVLDLFHLGWDREVLIQLDGIIDRVALVQLGDRMTTAANAANGVDPYCRRMLGEGDLPIEQWMHRLESLGYVGAYELELHGTGKDPFELISNSMEFVRSLSLVPMCEPPAEIAKSDQPAKPVLPVRGR